MPRLVIVVLILLALGATGFGAAQLLEARRLRTDAAALEKERAELRKKLWDLQKANADLNGRLARGPAAAASEAASEAVPVAESGEVTVVAGPGGGPAFRRGFDGRRNFEAVLNSPEVQQLMAMQQRGALDSRYAALFRNLNLNPAQLERLKQLLVEKQASVMDVMGAARAQGLTGRENRDELRQLVNDSQAEVDAMIRNELGESAYNQYKNYEATFPQRGTVDQLERRLSYSNTPLTPAQAEQVVQILAETSPAPGGNMARRGDFGLAVPFAAGPGVTIAIAGQQSSISNDAIARAQGVLQPQQVAALQGLQQEQQAAQQLQQQLRSMRNSARTENPATPPGGR